jgi:hypothetical protein
VTVIGSWSVECGFHAGGLRPGGHRPAIQPPVLVASDRSELANDHAFRDNRYEPSRATRIDVFASNSGGEVVDSLGLGAPGLAPGRQELRGSSFTIPLVAPLMMANVPLTPTYEIVGRMADGGPTVGAVKYALDPTPTGYNLTIDFLDDAGWMAFGATIYVGWTGPSASVGRQWNDSRAYYRLTPVDVEIQEPLCRDLENCGWDVTLAVDQHVIPLVTAATPITGPARLNVQGAGEIVFAASLEIGPDVEIRAFVQGYDTSSLAGSTSIYLWDAYLGQVVIGEPAAYLVKLAVRDDAYGEHREGVDPRCEKTPSGACLLVSFLVERIKPPATYVNASWSLTNPALVGDPLTIRVTSAERAWGRTRFDSVAFPISERPMIRTHPLSTEPREPHEILFTAPNVPTSVVVKVQLQSFDGGSSLPETEIRFPVYGPSAIIRLSTNTPRVGETFTATVTSDLLNPQEGSYTISPNGPGGKFRVGQAFSIKIDEPGKYSLGVQFPAETIDESGERSNTTGSAGASFTLDDELTVEFEQPIIRLGDTAKAMISYRGTWQDVSIVWRNANFVNEKIENIRSKISEATFTATMPGAHSLTVALDRTTGDRAGKTVPFYVEADESVAFTLPRPPPTYFSGATPTPPPVPPVSTYGPSGKEPRVSCAPPVPTVEFTVPSRTTFQFVVCKVQLPWNASESDFSYYRELGWQAPGNPPPVGRALEKLVVDGDNIRAVSGSGDVITIGKKNLTVWLPLNDTSRSPFNDDGDIVGDPYTGIPRILRRDEVPVEPGVVVPTMTTFIEFDRKLPPIAFPVVNISSLIGDARTGNAYGIQLETASVHAFHPDGTSASADGGVQPVAIAFDEGAGLLYVADLAGSAILAFDSDLNPLGSIAVQGGGPRTLAVDSDDGGVFTARSGMPGTYDFAGIQAWERERQATGDPTLIVLTAADFGIDRDAFAEARPPPATPTTTPTPGERDSELPALGLPWLVALAIVLALVRRGRAPPR